MNDKIHVPAMVEEIIHYLKPEKNQCFLDATFGAGGHSKAIANIKNTRIIAFDCDPDTRKYAYSMKKKLKDEFQFYNEKFANIENICKQKLENIKFDGIIFDLGVSSMQIDDQNRGFSFKYQSNIDMRMNQKGFNAYNAINILSKFELEQIFRIYAQETKARNIAEKIVQIRKKQPINNALQLAQICQQAKYNTNLQKINPATKVFQALRIFVNDEVNELIKGLHNALKVLKPNGKIIVISFHSLEDRIVKNFFRHNAQKLEEPMLEIITKKPITPTENEIKQNPRVRSAKMRIAKRTFNQYCEEKKYQEELFYQSLSPRLIISKQSIRYLKKIM